MSEDSSHLEVDENLDPITKSPHSHPLGTGVGAVGAGVAGAAVGTLMGGPLGGAIGSLVGSIIGGLGGHAIARKIDPTAEDEYWREHHREQPYATLEGDDEDDFEVYAPAYRTGYLGFSVYGEDQAFDEAEHDMRTYYEALESEIPWAQARPAALEAWKRVETNHKNADPDALGESEEEAAGISEGTPASALEG